jgi:hypothetical protein
MHIAMANGISERRTLTRFECANSAWVGDRER